MAKTIGDIKLAVLLDISPTVKQLRDLLRISTATFKELAKQSGVEIDTDDLERLEKELGDVERTSRKTAGGLKKTSTESKSLGKSAKDLRLKMLGVAAALTILTAPLGVAINEYVQMERGLREVGTLMGGLTEGEMRAMGDELMVIAANTGQAMDALTKAKYDIVSAGFASAAESAEVLNVSAMLAVGGVTEVSIASDLLTTTLNAYNLTAADAAEISDKLFTTVKLGKTTVEDMAGSLGRVLGVAGTLGIDLDELLGAFSTLTTTMGSSDRATTAVLGTINALLQPTAGLEKIINDLGFANSTAMIKQEGFANSIALIKEKADELNIPLTDVFSNMEALQGILPLTGTAAETFAQSIEDIGDSSGATKLAVEEMEKSAGLQMEKLKAQFHNVALTVGRVFVPAVLAATSAVSDLISQPLSKKLHDERVEFNALVAILKDANVEQHTRNQAIGVLQAKYGAYLGNLDLESASIDEIAKAQKRANEEFEKRIRLAAAEEILEEQARALADAEKKLFASTKSLALAEVELHAAGEDIIITGANIVAIMEAKKDAVDRDREAVTAARNEYQALYDALINQGLITEETTAKTGDQTVVIEDQTISIEDQIKSWAGLYGRLEDQRGILPDVSDAMSETDRRVKELTKDLGDTSDASFMAASTLDGFTDSMSRSIVSGGNLGDVVRDLILDMAALVIKMKIVKPLVEKVFDIDSSGAGSGGNGGGDIGVAEGMALGAAIGSVVPVVGTTIGGILGGLAGVFFADGGPVDRPTLALLGEDIPRSGIELVAPEKSFKRWIEESINPHLAMASQGVDMAQTNALLQQLIAKPERQVVRVESPSLYRLVVDSLAPELKKGIRRGDIDFEITSGSA